MVKSRRKTKSDLGNRMQGAAELLMDPLSLSSAVSAIYASMYTDTVNELVNRGLLIDTKDGEEVELSTTVAPPNFAQKGLADSMPTQDGPNRWLGLSFPLNGGSECKIDPLKWKDQEDKSSLAELMDGLVMAARLAGGGSDDQVMARLLPPVATANAPGLPSLLQNIGNAKDTGASDAPGTADGVDPYVNELHKILPPNLQQSDLFMGIIGEISTQMRSSGLLKQIEDQIASDVDPTAKKEPAVMTEERRAELEDGDLPDLENLPQELREKIEAQTKPDKAKADGQSSRINPMFMMKLSQSLLSGEFDAEGSGISQNLKGIAEKISQNLKAQVETKKIDPDVIKTDLTNALSFLSSVGLSGGGEAALKAEQVD